MMNTITEMMMGSPSPPFRMMAPSGAPMKKKKRHDRVSTNLLSASILCWRISLSPSLVSMPLKSSSMICWLTLPDAMFTAPCFLSSVKRA